MCIRDSRWAKHQQCRNEGNHQYTASNKRRKRTLRIRRLWRIRGGKRGRRVERAVNFDSYRARPFHHLIVGGYLGEIDQVDSAGLEFVTSDDDLFVGMQELREASNVSGNFLDFACHQINQDE